MRTITDDEANELRRSSGPPSETADSCPIMLALLHRLAARGLVVWVVDPRDGLLMPDITPRGRLALRCYEVLSMRIAS